jgi:hypothetical protein
VTMIVAFMRASCAVRRLCRAAFPNGRGNRDGKTYTERPAAMVCADDRAEDCVTAWRKLGASEAAESV